MQILQCLDLRELPLVFLSHIFLEKRYVSCANLVFANHDLTIFGAGQAHLLLTRVKHIGAGS